MPHQAAYARAACVGECMIELTEDADGALHRGYGGDTLNTAIYLARLGTAVDYVTALGDDRWSDEMVAHWQAEGVGTAHVRRLPGLLPGLYAIETDSSGERSFHYWRDSAAARRMFDGPSADATLAALAEYDLVQFSGITLSILPEPARARLFDALAETRAGGGRVAFDTNFRPRGWPDRAVARAVYRRAFAVADILLASAEDLELLFGPDWPAVLHEAASPELVLKAGMRARIRHDGAEDVVDAAPITQVVDTTAAGDSFAAAYLAARLNARPPAEAARAGHRLAGAVVGHRGAIIPLAAMPLLEPTP